MGFYWILWTSLAQLHYSSSLGFMGLPSTSYFLYFHYFGLTATHSYFSTSYTAHGLLFLSFRALLSPFTFSRPIFICLSHGPVIHYSCRLGLMGFLSVCQLLSILLTRLLLPTWASKMALNTNFGLLRPKQVFWQANQGYPNMVSTTSHSLSNTYWNDKCWTKNSMLYFVSTFTFFSIIETLC